MYRGRKFNSKKENIEGADGRYLGIQRFRFYIKCTACSRPITFSTDPKNADYEMESGATRNYEMQKDKAKTEEDAAEEEEEDKKNDPLKGLENRVLASQREMQDMDNLEQIQAMNWKHMQLLSNKDGDGLEAEANAILAARERKEAKSKGGVGTGEGDDAELNENGLTETEEAMIKSIKFGQQSTIRRLNEDDEQKSEAKRKHQAMMFESQGVKSGKSNGGTGGTMAAVVAKTKKAKKNGAIILKAKRKRAVAPPQPVSKKPKEPEKPAGIGGLLGGYGSDSDSD